MKKLKVWYRYKHDAYDTVEVETYVSTGKTLVAWVRNHGVWVTETMFVPWHNINCIEEIDA